MGPHYQIGRLILSSRNTYKVGAKVAKQCAILSENLPPMLINTSKEFNTRDNYVLVDTNKLQIVDNYGVVGDEQSDSNIYHRLYTYFWSSNSKLHKYFKDWNLDYDICKERVMYKKEVITIDPLGSIDLDDGFSLELSDDIINLDIHIADPTSYFDLSNPSTWQVLEELALRVSTCYIPLDSKIKHLMPELAIGSSNLLEQSTLIGTKKRAMSFCFRMDLKSGQVDFNIKKTCLELITNTTYEQYDTTINKDLEYKNKLITLTNFMIKNMGCKIDTEELNLESDISHKLIEVFMIWTNYYAGNYLYEKKNKMLVRTQDKFSDLDNSIPQYAKTFLNMGAKYKFVQSKTNLEYLHNSLGIKNYCHVSSPMRRFIDMGNHLLLHDIDTDEDKYNKLVKIIDIEKINSNLKTYKKISNAYDLITQIKTMNKFKACVFKVGKSKTLLVLFDPKTNFKKMIKVEMPIEYIPRIKQFDELDVELFYDPYKFKSKSFPFSIKIIS
jgi:exoribonuclease R